MKIPRPLLSLFLIALAVTADAANSSRPLPAARVLHQGPLEKSFAELEADIPGFAGWHYDSDGNAVISLKDVGRRNAALARIAPIVESRRGGDLPAGKQGGFRVREAKYSFLELAAFRDALKRNFPPQVIRVDVNEVRNALALGVERAGDTGAVRAAVAKLGIPADAVTVDVVQRPTPRLNLGDYTRPLRGGNSVVFYSNYYEQTSYCSIGVLGRYYESDSHRGFITASHCTTVPWSYSGNAAYQSAYLFYQFAMEYDDPDPFDANDSPYCWGGGYICRWSDSAFHTFTDETADGGATIHSTTSVNSGGPGSVTINGYLPVTSDAPASTSGTYVQKMGVTTGWTDATVGDTCVDVLQGVPAPPSGGVTKYPVLLCQDTTGLYIGSGDSGAPVYRNYTTYLRWVGILWGDDSEVSYHSPSWNVRADLPDFDY